MRGGGFLEKDTARQVVTGVFGLYGAQMLVAPTFLWTSNFKVVPDKYRTPAPFNARRRATRQESGPIETDRYHNFITRISGCFVLGCLRALSKLSPEEAFGITLPLSVVVAALGPVNAEMNLDTNTAHGAVYVLFPLLLMAHILAL